MQPRIHLRAGEVGPLAVHSFQHTGRYQVRNCLTYGDPADPEADYQSSLRRDGVARIQLGLDQVLEDAADLCAFGGRRRGLAIKSEGTQITPAMVLLQCVLTAPIR